MRVWAGAELNRRHEDFQSSALPTELPAHTGKIKELRHRAFCLLRHGCTMWESGGSVFINEQQCWSKYDLLQVLCGGVVVALRDGRSRRTSQIMGHNKFSENVVL